MMSVLCLNTYIKHIVVFTREIPPFEFQEIYLVGFHSRGVDMDIKFLFLWQLEPNTLYIIVATRVCSSFIVYQAKENMNVFVVTLHNELGIS